MDGLARTAGTEQLGQRRAVGDGEGVDDPDLPRAGRELHRAELRAVAIEAVAFQVEGELFVVGQLEGQGAQRLVRFDDGGRHGVVPTHLSPNLPRVTWSARQSRGW